MSLKILLTGKTGQIGDDLCRLLPALGEVLAPSRAELDLADPAGIRRFLRASQPQLIVNTAAYTAVDRAESEQALARAMNAGAPAVLAEQAANLGAALVHFSTDYVFDGAKPSPYEETDAPNPLNVYGTTKLAGENAVRDRCPRHFIVRSSWIYAPRGRNFLLTILKLASERDELRVVSDQVGAPTWSREVAQATVQMLSRALDAGLLTSSPAAARCGTYHMTAGGSASWFDFAVCILDAARRLANPPPWFRDATGGRPLIAQRVVPISSPAYPTPARRPACSILSNAKLERAFGVRLPAWHSQLDAVFAEP